jgi:hypothetical protein
MRDEPYIEWTPYALTLRPPTPSSAGTWQQLDTFASHLRAVNLPDPTKATARRVAAEHVRNEAARQTASTSVANNITQRLADGSLSPKDAAALFAKQPDANEAEATAEKVRREMDNQCRELVRLAVLAIHEYGEGWLDMLRPIAADAIKKRDQAMWDACVGFLAWLRDPMVGVCALGAALMNPTQDSEAVLYTVGNPRALFLWRVAHADPQHKATGQPTHLPDGDAVVPILLSANAAIPSVTDYAANVEAWRPGLYTAAQTIENMHRALGAQDAEIDALLHPEVVKVAQPEGDGDSSPQGWQPRGKKPRVMTT